MDLILLKASTIVHLVTCALKKKIGKHGNKNACEVGTECECKTIRQFFSLWPIKLRARCSQLLSGVFVERFRRHAR